MHMTSRNSLEPPAALRKDAQVGVPQIGVGVPQVASLSMNSGLPPAAEEPPRPERPVPRPGGIIAEVRAQFEECLDIGWLKHASDTYSEFIVEMTIDRSDRSKVDDDKKLAPPKNAVVKKVKMGKEMEGCIQNMPEGRNFLIRVVGKRTGQTEVKSPWVRAATLSPATREKDLDNLDPMNQPRMNCNVCPCPGYVPVKWSMNSPGKVRCRRCGCYHTDHLMVEVGEILKAREAKARLQLQRKEVVPLPSEALEWDNRECALWFWTDGMVHPRTTTGEFRHLPKGRSQAGGPEGPSGKKGRVSCLTPTTDTRHKFHEQIWKCFQAQSWPDKELVVIETYAERSSDFFLKKAQTDPRVVYVRYHRPRGSDWSIGAKRNVGAHLATGEFIANFDDDDFYAPGYLSTMVSVLEQRRACAVKLSSWYVYNMLRDTWHFCDPVAWGLTRGFDESAREVRSWCFGYGFSYVFRRQTGLDLWYDDINLGEDFNFIQQIQMRRGEKSVQLLHDDFGICLHVQHGGNTSESIPLRVVGRDEALDLDVMELAEFFPGDRYGSSQPCGGLLASAPPPSKRTRKVVAHLLDEDVTVKCAISATAAQFLECLEARLRSRLSDPGSLEDHRLYRVPPPVEYSRHRNWNETGRDSLAAEVLGIAFLAKLEGAEENLHPDSKSGAQWRKLLERAKQPMQPSERLGLRTTELWVLPPSGEAKEEEEDIEDGLPDEEFINVKVTCQRSTVKQFFAAAGTFTVRLLKGSTVEHFREVLQSSLPEKAKVLATKPGKGLVLLSNAEQVPEEVTVSDFKGTRTFFMRFTPRQCAIVLRMIRRLLKKPEAQAQLDAFEANSRGSDVEYKSQLVQLLSHEIYPEVFRRFDVPVHDDIQSPKVVMEAMVHVGWTNYELSSLWLEVAMLMRNRGEAQAAWESVERFRPQYEGGAEEQGEAPWSQQPEAEPPPPPPEEPQPPPPPAEPPAAEPGPSWQAAVTAWAAKAPGVAQTEGGAETSEVVPSTALLDFDLLEQQQLASDSRGVKEDAASQASASPSPAAAKKPAAEAAQVEWDPFGDPADTPSASAPVAEQVAEPERSEELEPPDVHALAMEAIDDGEAAAARAAADVSQGAVADEGDWMTEVAELFEQVAEAPKSGEAVQTAESAKAAETAKAAEVSVVAKPADAAEVAEVATEPPEAATVAEVAPSSEVAPEAAEPAAAARAAEEAAAEVVDAAAEAPEAAESARAAEAAVVAEARRRAVAKQPMMEVVVRHRSEAGEVCLCVPVCSPLSEAKRQLASLMGSESLAPRIRLAFASEPLEPGEDDIVLDGEEELVLLGLDEAPIMKDEPTAKPEARAAALVDSYVLAG